MHAPTREGWIIISFTVVIFGVMALLLIITSRLANYACDGCLARPFHNGIEELVSAIGAFVCVVVSFLIGIVVWLLVMKPFYSRDEIEPFMKCPPGIPVLSKFARIFNRVTFDLIFPHNKN